MEPHDQRLALFEPGVMEPLRVGCGDLHEIQLMIRTEVVEELANPSAKPKGNNWQIPLQPPEPLFACPGGGDWSANDPDAIEIHAVSSTVRLDPFQGSDHDDLVSLLGKPPGKVIR